MLFAVVALAMATSVVAVLVGCFGTTASPLATFVDQAHFGLLLAVPMGLVVPLLVLALPVTVALHGLSGVYPRFSVGLVRPLSAQREAFVG